MACQFSLVHPLGFRCYGMNSSSIQRLEDIVILLASMLILVLVCPLGREELMVVVHYNCRQVEGTSASCLSELDISRMVHLF